jgi:adenylate kinase
VSINRLVVAVTGTPGVGKSLFSKQLASKARNAKVIEINDIVHQNGLYSGLDKFGSKIVDLRALNSALKRKVRASQGLVIVAGHLVPDLNFGQRITIVLRLSLKGLKARLRKRKYPEEKIKENLISEALDYCGIGVAGKGAEVYEAESAKERRALMGYVLSVYGGKPQPRPKPKSISKMGELLELIKEGYPL